ncbi:MAG TPA: uracil-DNA glycosylase [bacterium]|nr:uracil-DNA glycosylase [bacterium]
MGKNEGGTGEPALFLKFLKEEGIDEIYLTGQKEQPPGRQTLGAEPSRAVVKEAPGFPAPSSIKEELLQLREKVLRCKLCGELAANRKSVVFGAGNIKADLVFVGEAPGRDEDLQGLPFVGRAGQLLTKIIESIGLERKQVFICNVLKCRPPGNRPPRPEEVLNCQPYLLRQLELIQPKIICALGTFAAQSILKTGEPISKLRGRFVDYPDVNIKAKVICTFHPAYLLRNPAEKRKVWEDMKMIRKELECGHV